MEMDMVYKTTVPNEDDVTAEPEAELSKIALLEGISSRGDVVQEIASVGQVITRIELDLACSAEKLVNLNVLTMHVGTRESDFEALVSHKDDTWGDSSVKAMEFNLLSGILDSEVTELDNFMSTVQTDVINAHEIVSSCNHLGEALDDMEHKLNNSAEFLKQSIDQVSEIKAQSAKFQRILSCFGGEENWKGDVDYLGRSEFLDQIAEIKMQTPKQQRDFLRMLEQSLARELDLEKKVDESRQFEEEMNLRLHSSEQEALFMEEAATVVWERLFEAENAAQVLMGISKETLGRLQIVQFNLDGSIQREEKLRFELQESMGNLKAKDSAIEKLEDKLALVNREAFTLRDKVSSLEKQLEDSETELLNAKEKVYRAESRAESVDAKCKLLTEANMKLIEELDLLKRSSSEQVESRERQLREYDIQLQHALASVVASQEKESMLYSTIHDMENLIEDLKSRVTKADSRAESAEDKCITLSEFNSDLNEELSFLRSRLECMEASLRQAEETKLATAKDICIRTKVITDLVMQLALERERLHKQIYSLTKENKILIQQAHNDASRALSHDGRGNGKHMFSKQGFSNSNYAREEEASDPSATNFEADNTRNSTSAGKAELRPEDSASKLETVGNIEARQLNFKYGFMVALVLAISAWAVFWLQNPRRQFWKC